MTSTTGHFGIVTRINSGYRQSTVRLTDRTTRAKTSTVTSVTPSFFGPKAMSRLISFFTPVYQTTDRLPFCCCGVPSVAKIGLPMSGFLVRNGGGVPGLMKAGFARGGLVRVKTYVSLRRRGFRMLRNFSRVLVTNLSVKTITNIKDACGCVPGICRTVFRSVGGGRIRATHT